MRRVGLNRPAKFKNLIKSGNSSTEGKFTVAYAQKGWPANFRQMPRGKRKPRDCLPDLHHPPTVKLHLVGVDGVHHFKFYLERFPLQREYFILFHEEAHTNPSLIINAK